MFFYWDPERTDILVNYVACSLDLELYLNITSELLNLYLNDHHLVPRSSYRKAIGEGARTITYGAHTSLAALQKSHKFVTNIRVILDARNTLHRVTPVEGECRSFIILLSIWIALNRTIGIC